MPKKKTSKTAAKRLKVSSRGKLMYRKPGHGHLLGSKSRKTKRHMRRDGHVAPADYKRLKAML